MDTDGHGWTRISNSRQIRETLARIWPVVILHARFELASSTAPRRFDRCDINLAHLHHRIEGAFGGSAIRIG
jgi:hypothetical protein